MCKIDHFQFGVLCWNPTTWAVCGSVELDSSMVNHMSYRQDSKEIDEWLPAEQSTAPINQFTR